MNASSAKPAKPPSSRGRPRAQDTDQNILGAARELLAHGGFDALSFDAVAQLAGVTRPTIYRRWPSKVHLANEIANGGGEQLADIIEAQGLEAQIRAFVDLLVSQYQRPETRAASAGLIVSYQRDPQLRDALHTPIETQARKNLAAIIEKGKRLSLVDLAVDSDAVFDVAVGAVIFRMLFSSLPPSGSTKDALCATIVSGITRRP